MVTKLTTTGPGCSEDHVQNVARAVLDELGLLWAHAPNEALQRGGALYGCFLVGQGVKAGLPDCLIFDPPTSRPDARGVALELKTVRGSPTPDQRRWLSALEARGWVTGCPKGTHELLDVLRELWGEKLDQALDRLAARGETVSEDGRLVVSRPGAKRAPARGARTSGQGAASAREAGK